MWNWIELNSQVILNHVPIIECVKPQTSHHYQTNNDQNLGDITTVLLRCRPMVKIAVRKVSPYQTLASLYWKNSYKENATGVWLVNKCLLWQNKGHWQINKAWSKMPSRKNEMAGVPQLLMQLRMLKNRGKFIRQS